MGELMKPSLEANPEQSERDPFRCVLHGSFRRNFPEIVQAHEVFSSNGIDVLAPKQAEIASVESGFVLLEGEENLDPRLVEGLYLHNLKKLGPNGFSYFVNPGGYIGKSASYELAVAQMTNTPVYFQSAPEDLPVYVPDNSIWSPQDLTEHIQEKGELPQPTSSQNSLAIHQLWKELVLHGSTIATGAIIEYVPPKTTQEKEVLLVQTHKWGGRYSVVGEKVRMNELLLDALSRGIQEETGLSLDSAEHLCTFDKIKDSGYYLPQHLVFVDYVVGVKSKKVTLDDEAEHYVWIPAAEALTDLSLEPNARHTLELYEARKNALRV